MNNHALSRHSIAVIAGDGIGNEVVPAAIDCLERITRIHSLNLEFTYFDWGSDTEDYLYDLGKLFVENLKRYCNGEPLDNIVDKTLGFVSTRD